MMANAVPHREVVACFGEVLLRLSPTDNQLLGQASQLDMHFGGAEANVAVALANLGRPTRMISALPENRLGDSARGALARHGVDVSGVLKRDGRMGQYFFTPSVGARQGEVLYDRKWSAFTRSGPECYDFETLLKGARHLHISGISLALSEEAAIASQAIAGMAKDRGLTLSYDGNFRPTLWQQAGREPLEWIDSIVSKADVFFGNHKDTSLLLGKTFSGDGSQRRREAAEALMYAYPGLSLIASTARHVETGNQHRITGRIDTPNATEESDEFILADIVDRIGTGDAFAAGILDGWLDAPDDLKIALDRGMGLAALKHSTTGDFSLANLADLNRVIAGGGDVSR